MPGAGTFAATFYAYGELLLHDQDVYDGHCWSEGNHQWLYAGLCTGNYGLTYSGLRLWQYPYLPHFDLLKMHPLSVDIGVPWTSQFFTGKDGWQKPENIVTSIDQFLAATIAYGHIGWLVEETHGIRQTCRSYYMLQPLQSRYAMLKPQEIRYGTDRGLVSSSEAFLQRRVAQIEALRPLSERPARLGQRQRQGVLAGRTRGHDARACRRSAGSPSAPTASSSVPKSLDGKRYDRVSSPECVFLDGRGTWRSFDGIGTSGSVAVRRAEGGHGPFDHHGRGRGPARHHAARKHVPFCMTCGRPSTSSAQAETIAVRAFDQNDKQIGEAATRHSISGWEIRPPKSTVRLEITPKEHDRNCGAVYERKTTNWHESTATSRAVTSSNWERRGPSPGAHPDFGHRAMTSPSGCLQEAVAEAGVPDPRGGLHQLWSRDSAAA